jgi:hypothetical protein
MDSTWIISTIRAQETVDATSPAAVLAKLEREEADYVQYVSGCQRSTLKQTHGKNGVPCLTAIVGLALALLVGCDATGITVHAPDAGEALPCAANCECGVATGCWSNGDDPVWKCLCNGDTLPTIPPSVAPVPPPVAVPAPLPPVQPPLAPEPPLPAPTPPPPVPPCFDRDLGTIAPCAGRTDCTVSSTVTERTMCQAGGVVYVPSCETCTGVW